ncbi:hypothetical protein [Oceanithermus sp.]
MKKRLWLFWLVLLALPAGCAGSGEGGGGTLFGFFPTPAEPSVAGLVATLEGISEHADLVSLQERVPWAEFAGGEGPDSRAAADLRNLVELVRQRGLQAVFVVDPLNGLDRRQFIDVPADWGRPSFADARIRAAYKNFALWLARSFEPEYLGLGSEINTYLAAYPADAASFASLYRETYDAIKAEFPDMHVFLTFQWDHLVHPEAYGLPPTAGIDWRLIEQFEPRLDVWAISSYPCFYFRNRPIPADYYRPLARRTGKPLAVAEGGCSAETVGEVPGSPADQERYLRALAGQLGGRLSFWVYLLYNDLDLEAYRAAMGDEFSDENLQTLSYFAKMGLTDERGRARAALRLWDGLRGR